MNLNQVSHFRTVDELQNSIDGNIESLNKKIDEYSKLIGEKIRSEEENNKDEFTDLKEKLDMSESKDKKSNSKDKKSNSKDKKQKKSKKGEQKDWIEFQGIHLYNGVGTRGEIELYFKSLEDMKLKVEKLENTKKTIEQLAATGIKKELGCIGFEQENGPYELAFVSSKSKRAKFAYKTIMTIGCEQ